MIQKSEIRFLDVGQTYSLLKPEIDLAISRVLSGGVFVLGEECESFEREFADYVGAKHCVGVANGLDALFLSLKALGVDNGSEVIVPAHTFIATWLAVTMARAKIVPADIDVDTYNLIPENVEQLISQKTRAIIPVHLYGLPAEMKKLKEISTRFDIPLLEDAAQCHGAEINGQLIGSGDSLTAWSFYPGKNLGAFGDGGAICTDNSDLYKQLRVLRNYGSSQKYVHELQGVNSRLDEIQAAVLRVKLRYLDQWNNRRAEVASIYSDRLKDLPIKLPSAPNGVKHAWHLYVVLMHDRDAARDELLKDGIETGIHYPTPIYLQDAYRSTFENFRSENAEFVSRNCLSLPIGPHLNEAEVHRVCDALINFVEKPRRTNR